MDYNYNEFKNIENIENINDIKLLKNIIKIYERIIFLSNEITDLNYFSKKIIKCKRKILELEKDD